MTFLQKRLVLIFLILGLFSIYSLQRTFRFNENRRRITYKLLLISDFSLILLCHDYDCIELRITCCILQLLSKYQYIFIYKKSFIFIFICLHCGTLGYTVVIILASYYKF